ncbi:MAG: LPXTG cell wall anchor domain-containing protein [Candidatus Eisenbacteria bacterium]
MKARKVRIGALIGVTAIAGFLAFTPSTVGARPAGAPPEFTPLGTFQVGATINAPYDCDDLAEIAAGAWGVLEEDGPRGDTDLPVNGSTYSFSPIAEPGDYVAVVLCGFEEDEEQIVERMMEGIFDVGDTTDEYLYSFTLIDECGLAPDTTTAPGTTSVTPTTTTSTTIASTSTTSTTSTSTTSTTSTSTTSTSVVPGPARAPHGVDCPDVDSGGGSLPETGSSDSNNVATVAVLALMAGGALLVGRRRGTI